MCGQEVTIRKALVVAAVVVVVLLPQPVRGSVSQYPLVMSGDSITRLSEVGIMGNGRLIDAEDGRNPYQRGLLNRMSSNEAMQLLIPMVAPGGTFVFQDNGAGATVEQWRKLLRDIVTLLPDDRCLIGVLPVWVAPGSPTLIADAGAKAGIMVEELKAQPCHEWVRWNQQVKADPTLVYDGQHPTPEGSAWLASEITVRSGHIPQGASCATT